MFPSTIGNLQAQNPNIEPTVEMTNQQITNFQAQLVLDSDFRPYTVWSIEREQYAFVTQTKTQLTNKIIIQDDSEIPTVLEDGVLYSIELPLGVTEFALTKPLDFSNTTTITSVDLNSNTVIYSGVGTLIQGSLTGSMSFGGGIVRSLVSEEIWDLTGTGNPSSNIVVTEKLTFENFSGKGIFDGIGGVVTPLQYANCGTGLIMKDVTISSISASPFNNSVDSLSPQIVYDGTIVSLTIVDCPLQINPQESFIQFSNNLNVLSTVKVNGNSFSASLGGEFLATEKTGGITVYGDNLAGGTTVTSAAHGLTIEQVSAITGSTNYNAPSHQIFNITPNTFDIPVLFAGDDAAGTFSTGDSNDFLDAFEIESNGDARQSNEIFKMEINTLITITPLIVGDPVLIEGSGTDWTPITMRRFDFELDGLGTVRYTGNKIDKPIKIEMELVSDIGGGSSTQSESWITLNGSIVLESSNIQESGRSVTHQPSALLDLNNGDYIGGAIANNDDLNVVRIPQLTFIGYSQK